MPASRFGARLLTQNLLASASTYEGTTPLSWTAIHDLCVLIDLFCLYDDFRVLGRHAYAMYPREDSDFWSVPARYRSNRQSSKKTPASLRAACGHLGAYLGETEKTTQFEPLFMAIVSPDSVSRAFSGDADTERDVAMGRDWLPNAPARHEYLGAAYARGRCPSGGRCSSLEPFFMWLTRTPIASR